MTASLVIQTSFLGDVILTTPLLAQLANRGPVDVLVTPAASALLVGHPSVREVLVYDKRGRDSGLSGLVRMAMRLRRMNFETVYLAQGSWRSAVGALLAGIPNRVGFSTSSGRFLYTKRVPYRDDWHHAARLLHLSRPNGREATQDELRPTIVPGKAEREEVEALLLEHHAALDEPLIALAPGSVWGTKRWPYYPELAALLADQGRIVVLGSEDDAPLARAVEAAVPNAIDATGRLALLASAELIGRCRVLVTNDSSPLHLASAMGTPTVALFGPTVPQFGFGPLAARSAVIGVEDLPCRPCDRHGPRRCPLKHHRCMRDITPRLVAERTRAVLLNQDPIA